MNGVLSIGLAGASVQNSQPPRPVDPLYERALDQAMQWWLRHVIWTTAAYFAAATIIAAVLCALSYWLLHSPHGRHCEAH
jgi:ABC-type branched-subunit amino acid transport system permease subunit